jgi:hypothetical protein
MVGISAAEQVLLPAGCVIPITARDTLLSHDLTWPSITACLTHRRLPPLYRHKSGRGGCLSLSLAVSRLAAPGLATYLAGALKLPLTRFVNVSAALPRGSYCVLSVQAKLRKRNFRRAIRSVMGLACTSIILPGPFTGSSTPTRFDPNRSSSQPSPTKL